MLKTNSFKKHKIKKPSYLLALPSFTQYLFISTVLVLPSILTPPTLRQILRAKLITQATLRCSS